MQLDEGFMHDDCFLVRAEIRLKLQDNERWKVSVNRKTATCTVRSTSLSILVYSWCPQWELKGLQGMCPTVLMSEIFKIGTTEWCVRYRQGKSLMICHVYHLQAVDS